MKKIIFFSALFCVLQTVTAQTIIQRDPEIESMIREVSADSMKSYITQLVSYGTRNTLSSTTDPKRGVGVAREWIHAKMEGFARNSSGRLTVLLDTTTYQPDGRRVNKAINLGNIVATLKGTDPADPRIFLISGHLDNMRTSPTDFTGDAPGANDDASGSAAVIECARIMSKHNFPATIIFTTVSGEEQGLLGAYYMAKKMRAQNVQIEAVLNNDIMGSNNSSQTKIINNTQVRVFSEGLPAYPATLNTNQIRSLALENDGRSRQLARYVKEIGERYVDNLQVVMIYRSDRFLRGGDQTPYLENGYAGVRITEMNENYEHQHQNVRLENGVQYGDLLEFMDFEYLRKNTCLNLANLASLAKAPATPDSVKIEIKSLNNYTRLSWNAPKTGRAKGYYVLIRETTSPVWQKKIFTAQTEMVLPMSKDNYFFAVQSVNDAGNESLPTTPLPGTNR